MPETSNDLKKQFPDAEPISLTPEYEIQLDVEHDGIVVKFMIQGDEVRNEFINWRRIDKMRSLAVSERNMRHDEGK